jgi:hypothetical protein
MALGGSICGCGGGNRMGERFGGEGLGGRGCASTSSPPLVSMEGMMGGGRAFYL